MSTDTTPTTDRIERSTLLNAPRERVWRALSSAEAFGTWFGLKLDGQTFAAGQRNRAQLSVKGYEHIWLDLAVERVEPQTTFAYRWHPFAVDPAVDYAQEEPTLVTFTLADAPGGRTQLTVVESGFDRVPAHRRAQAWRMNSAGWDGQLRNITRHLEAGPDA
jgi:uncharacterized protein YndB with AHSA1/START domain